MGAVLAITFGLGFLFGIFVAVVGVEIAKKYGKP